MQQTLSMQQLANLEKRKLYIIILCYMIMFKAKIYRNLKFLWSVHVCVHIYVCECVCVQWYAFRVIGKHSEGIII